MRIFLFDRESSRESELERKRAEMMENAKWRQQEREKNVQKYKEQDEKEDEMMKKMQEDKHGEAFLK